MTAVNNHLLNVASIFRCISFRGKSVIWNQLQRKLECDEKIIVQFPRGFKLQIDLREYWQRQMMAACYDRREYWVLNHLMASGDNFVDVGANMGYYSVSVASAVKNGQVIAIEANPRMAKQLRENAHLNPNLNLKVLEIAASDQEGQVSFYLPPDNGWQSVQGSMIAMENGTKHEVKALTIDQIIEDHQLTKVQLCKMDIEGAEPIALKGCRKALQSGNIESFSIEVTNETRDEILSFMKDFKFDFILDMRTWKEPDSSTDFKNGMTNILWLRGACAERWKQISWQKYFN